MKKPEYCPHCNRQDCLVSHGCYERKGLSGGSSNFKPFFIQRFLCTIVRRTVSVHPQFSQTMKRYQLSFVFECLSELLEKKRVMNSVAREKKIYRQTLKRWSHSFANAHTEAKRICFYMKDQLPTSSLVSNMFMYFRSLTVEPLAEAGAMIKLYNQFSTPLY